MHTQLSALRSNLSSSNNSSNSISSSGAGGVGGPLQTGDFVVTQHSNLNHINAVFHLVLERGSGTSSSSLASGGVDR